MKHLFFFKCSLFLAFHGKPKNLATAGVFGRIFFLKYKFDILYNILSDKNYGFAEVLVCKKLGPQIRKLQRRLVRK
jgi:hypothetical protein